MDHFRVFDGDAGRALAANKALLVNSRSGRVFHGVGVWLRSGCARAWSFGFVGHA
jgi:hypothetical protein